MPTSTNGIAPSLSVWMRDVFGAIRSRRASSVRADRILNLADEGVYTTDSAGTVTFVNIAAGRMLHTDVHLIVGRNIHELCHQPNTDAATCAVCSPLAATRTDTTDVQLRRADGSTFPIEYSSTSMVENGEVIRVVTFKDISERKKAEIALRQSELKFRSVAESANDGLVSADPAGRIAAWNRGAEAIFGYTEDEALGQPLTILMPEMYRDAHRTGLSRFQETGNARVIGRTVEVEGLRKDGTVFPMELSLAHWDQDERRYFTGIIRDLTERKQAETALAREVGFVQLLQSVALAANEASSSKAALKTALQYICEHTGWPIGHVYWVGDDPKFPLEPSDIWHVVRAADRFDRFMDITRETKLRSGEGLPGRALETRRPAWIPNVTIDSNFPRHAAATEAGIAVGVAFPILIGQDVPAVLEFFSNEALESDTALSEVMGQIGTQLGRVIERERSEERLTHHALHDPLTALPNRTLLQDRLQSALNRRREDRIVAVLFFDLDRFKLINDSLGHEVGDHVLKAVTERLRRILRPEDTVGRFGGDEFVIVCDDLASEQEAVELAARLVDGISLPFDLDDTEIFLTTSIGIALGTRRDVTPNSLLRDADAALYRAKDRGRGRWEVFSDMMRSQSIRRLETVSALHRAIERNELELRYQPQYNIQTGSITGMEALVRWRHPERGLLPPADFIPLAEETGLIISLGRWVLNEACAQAQTWRNAYGWAAALNMSVNISPRQLSQPRLVDDVATALAETGFDPTWLTLEITESVAMLDLEATVQRLGRLKELGVRLAVDDFGTGYASLGYLRELPIDELKIDRSFIEGLGGSAEQSAVATAIVRLAQTLRLRTVAEGVEHKVQLEGLRDLECDNAQGFYFARPLEVAQLDGLLRAQYERHLPSFDGDTTLTPEAAKVLPPAAL